MTLSNTADTNNVGTKNNEQSAPTPSIFDLLCGTGKRAADIAKEAAPTHEQNFRSVIKAGMLFLDGDAGACRQIAVQTGKAVTGGEAILSRKHGQIQRVARYVASPAAMPQVKQAIQNQNRRIKGGEFRVHEGNPMSTEGGLEKIIQAIADEPVLYVLVMDEPETKTADIPAESLAALHQAALQYDVTVFLMGDSALRPAGAGFIRITQESGSKFHTVHIEQEGLPSQKLFLDIEGGARLSTHAEQIADAEVLEYLQAEGGAEVKTSIIRERFGLDSANCSAILKRLVSDSKAVSTKHAHYAAVMPSSNQL
jgi:hypothetical protein